jgi:hypothetical protein
MAPDSSLACSSSLRLELSFAVEDAPADPSSPTTGGVAVVDLIATLEDVSWLLGLSLVLADRHAMTESDDPVAEAAESVALRRIQYASPVQAVLDLAPLIAGSVPAVAAVVYGLRRLWSLDVELRTARQESKKLLAEAKTVALLADRQYRAAVRGAAVADELWDSYLDGGDHPHLLRGSKDSEDQFAARVDRSQLPLFVSEAIDARGASERIGMLVGLTAALTDAHHPPSSSPGLA